MVLNLLDLPTEILFHILGHLSTRERYNLALTCHILNVISIQIYLSAYHIPYPGNTANIRVTDWAPAHRARTSELDALYALSIALDLKEVEDFTCHLDGPSFDRKHLDFLARKVRRLTRFIERLERVQKFHLYLDWDIDYSPPDDSFRILDTQLEDWARTSESLFNTIIEKGCTDLTMQYGAYMQDAYGFRLIPIAARPISNLGHSIRRRIHSTGSALAISYGSGWEYFRRNTTARDMIQHSQLSYNATRSCVLRSLSIHSTLMLMPPCLTWTISILRVCPSISSLSLAHIKLPSKHAWMPLLSLIADAVNDRLLEIFILNTCEDLTEEHIFEFLRRLPKLRKLHLDMGITSFTPIPKRSMVQQMLRSDMQIPEFCHLRTLQAPAAFISHILHSRNSSSSSSSPVTTLLPELEQLHISINLPLGAKEDEQSWPAALLNPILKCIKYQPRTTSVMTTLDVQTTTRFSTYISKIPSGTEPYKYVDSVIIDLLDLPMGAMSLGTGLCVLFPEVPTLQIVKLTDSGNPRRRFDALVVDAEKITAWLPQVKTLVLPR